MSDSPLIGLLRPELAELRAYLPHAGDFRIRLDANEAPPLFPPAVRERLASAFAELALERYPDPTSSELRRAIATRLGVSVDEVLVGVGSDELIGLLLTVLCAPSAGIPTTVVSSTPSFVMYKMSARVRGQRALEVPLDGDWDISADGLLRAIEMSQASIAFVASPNNPTGNLASIDRLRRVIEGAPGTLIVIDEAYIDYAECDQLELYRRYPNVIILRTLSKIGFAALRVGWLLGRAELVAELDKARLPYNMNSVSQRLASVVLSELTEPISAVLRGVIGERERLFAELSSLPGISVTPSQANFLWLRSERPAGELFSALCQKKILVRSFHERGGRLAHQLRVTIGTPAENDELVRSLREVT